MMNFHTSEGETNLSHETAQGDAQALNETRSKSPSLSEHRPYTDKYFIRSNEILQTLDLNPTVRAQVFIRKGPAELAGVEEVINIIRNCSNFFENGGKVYGLKGGSLYNSKDTLLLFEGPAQDILELETVYLGVLSRATTRANGGPYEVDLEKVRQRAAAITELAGDRPVSYYGARHWHYEEDARIASAAFNGGFISASTDIAARVIGQQGTGTIPHALENILALYQGKENAVVEAVKAFDAVIDKNVPRIALIDYANKEIDDSLASAEALKGRLFAVRVDTPGENIAQGALESGDGQQAQALREQGLNFPKDEHPDSKFWYGTGVTVSGVYALRKALDEAGHEDLKIILTSGFGKIEKLQAFIDAERQLGMKLFDGLGAGGLYESHAATMDIVAAKEEGGEWQAISKAGRSYRPNSALIDLTPELD